MTQLSVAPGWTFSQLTKLRKQRPQFVDAALDELLNANPDLRYSLVLNAYLDEEINLGKAAELLKMHELELREQFVKSGVPLRIGAANLAEAEAEVKAIKHWRAIEENESAK